MTESGVDSGDQGKQAKPRVPDWERIESDYRSGSRSSREIAAEHGVTEGAIRKRAKSLGWVRDLKVLSASSRVVFAQLDEFAAAGFVYVVGLESSDRFYKIGMAKAFPPRLEAHQCASPFDLFVACAFFVPNMRQEERRLHQRFADNRVRGEWFRLADSDLREIAAGALLVEAEPV